MSREVVKPYLVSKGEDNQFRITVRTTRLNSNGYPLVSSVVLDEPFRTATLARTHLRTEYGALTTDIASK